MFKNYLMTAFHFFIFRIICPVLWAFAAQLYLGWYFSLRSNIKLDLLTQLKGKPSMRKHILAATLAGLCIMGVTACQQKPSDKGSEPANPTTTSEAATQQITAENTNVPAQPEQAAPAQSTDLVATTTTSTSAPAATETTPSTTTTAPSDTTPSTSSASAPTVSTSAPSMPSSPSAPSAPTSTSSPSAPAAQ